MMKLLTFILLPTLAMSFSPVSRPVATAASSLDMAPKFDKTQNKWLPASTEEGPEGGYDIWGSLLRQGPLPFFTRLFSSEEYEQGKDSMKIVKETRMQHLSKSNLTGMSFSPLS
jgi:hypothetical protein